MKKAILLLLFICSFVLVKVSAQNQQIVISDTSNSIVNGSTITVYSANINTDFMDISLRVKNNTLEELRMFVRRIINNEVDSSTNSFCFGIRCYPSTTDTSEDAVLLAPGLDTTFLGDYQPSHHTGKTSITYEFYEGSHTSVPAQVTVNYIVSPLGLGNDLNSYEFSRAFPNPASSSTSFEYNIPDGSKGNILVRNLLGSIVRDVKLDKLQGRAIINTNDLKDGVYFYSLILDNKAIVTKKLIIRH